MDQAERELQHFVGKPVLGFDIEWEPSAKKTHSAKQNVSLIQIACEDRICLLHIAVFRGDAPEDLMPPTLRAMLQSDQVVKAGVNIVGDARRIERYLGVSTVGQFELSYLFKVVTFPPHEISRSLKGASLAAQVQSVLLLPLKKDEVRVSSWSRTLSKEQADYSASDAYAGFRLFHALEARRKAMVPCPPRPAFRELNAPIELADGTVVRPASKKTKAASGDAKAEDVDDEVDEEFFDALETQDTYELSAGVPLAGVGVSYPALPVLENLRIDADEAEETATTKEVAATTKDETPPTTSDASPPTALKRGVPPPSPEISLADAWLTSFQPSSTQSTRASTPSLRAYHLWHHQGHSIATVAALCRTPPLAPYTVASYILEALKVHEDLECERGRAEEVLGVLPGVARGRYWRVKERIGL